MRLMKIAKDNSGSIDEKRREQIPLLIERLQAEQLIPPSTELRPTTFALLLGIPESATEGPSDQRDHAIRLAIALENAFACRDLSKKTMARLCLGLKEVLGCTDEELTTRINAARTGTGGRIVTRSWVTRNLCAARVLEERPELEELGVNRLFLLYRLLPRWIHLLSSSGMLGGVNVFNCTHAELQSEVNRIVGGDVQGENRLAWDRFVRSGMKLVAKLPSTPEFQGLAEEFEHFLDRMEAVVLAGTKPIQVPEIPKERRKAA